MPTASCPTHTHTPPTQHLCPNTRHQLKEALLSLAIQRGDFILASGKRSNVYIDCRNLSLDGPAVTLAGEALYQCMENLHVDAVAGVVLGAAPLVTATSIAAHRHGNALKGCLIRKASKGHGTQKLIEGQIEPWMRVILVEDVVTTGGSLVFGIEQLKQTYPQLTIAGILSLVDRESGGHACFAQYGIPYWPLFTISELLS